MATSRAYLDWNATAPLLPSARAVMLDVLDMAGNPSSVHREGRALRAIMEGARRAIASMVGTDAAHVTLTSGATEAANHVLTPNFRMGKAALDVSQLLVSAIEHKAIRDGGRFPADRITEVAVTSAGALDLGALKTLLEAHDKSRGLMMLALMLVNNETGIIQPVREAADLVHAQGGVMVVDAVQAVGRMPVNIRDLDADFLIISSHKIGGPKGAGALISRGEVMMPTPLIRGGGQEKYHRSGTENVAAIAGFGAAVTEMSVDIEARAAKIAAMRDQLEAEFLTTAPDILIHGTDAARISNTSFFSLPGLKAETGQIAFDLENVALSAGSACSSGKVGDSHVLNAMGQDGRHGALRISLGVSTTEADIEQAVTAFRRIAGRRKPAVDAA